MGCCESKLPCRVCVLFAAIPLVLVFLVFHPSWASEPTAADISYGPYESNKLDLWQASSDKATPLIVQIHGGGFYEGDKTNFRGGDAAEIARCLDAGVSVASVNYRFLAAAAVQDIVRDSARAIQFLRHNATTWNIDKTRVAAFGDSAGAGISLWLAFHNDLADPTNPDPVLRESTRLLAAGGLMPQATYDFAKWPSILGIPQYVWYVSMWGVAPRYYRLGPLQANLAAGKKIRADLDMLSWIDSSDPPVYLFSDHPDTKLTYANLFRFLYRELCKKKGIPFAKAKQDDVPLSFDILHHPAHARALKRMCDAKGISCVAVYRDTPPEQRLGVYDFLLKHLHP